MILREFHLGEVSAELLFSNAIEKVLYEKDNDVQMQINIGAKYESACTIFRVMHLQGVPYLAGNF
ncbi:MAG: hypothetical protein HW390_1859 [Candidatus Brocadiaceae bacterium]|nr:hypothetical protein [Candidatus Brocadiaceae bacterium]